MQTNPANGPTPVFRPVTPPPLTQAAKDDKDQVQIGQAIALKQALDETPVARVSKIEEARELVDDPKYPPREVIEHISHLLAINWPPEIANQENNQNNK